LSNRFLCASLCAAALTAVLWSPASRARTKLRIACVELTLESGVSEGTRDLLYERLLTQVGAMGSHEVLGKTDIDTMLGLEEERQKLGCLDKASCIAEIGGALGVQQIISGNIGRIGESLLINLKRIDVRQAMAVSRVSRRFKGGSEEQILDALPAIVEELFRSSAEVTDHEPVPDQVTPKPQPGPAREAEGQQGEGPAAEPEAVAPPPSEPAPVPGSGSLSDDRPSLLATQSFWGWLAVGVGGATIVAGAGAGGYALKQQHDLEKQRYNHSTYNDQVDGIESSALAADVLLSIGALATGVGLLVLLLDGGDEAQAAETGAARIELQPMPAGLGLRGSF